MSRAPSSTAIRDIYTKMLLTRLVDDCTRNLYAAGHIQFVTSCRGYEAAQVASAVCIEVGNDFTLPYHRDLGVMLTIGMTPYEVFRTYLQAHQQHPLSVSPSDATQNDVQRTQHWSYHKHNTITGTTSAATQLLHAAGIAFACKLRKASAVTIAYCGDDVVDEPDFLESLRFAAQHKLPVVFICEQDCSHAQLEPSSVPSCTHALTLPHDLIHERIDGTDAAAIYTATQTALQRARTGQGPTLLEMYVTSPYLGRYLQSAEAASLATGSVVAGVHADPFAQCRRYLEAQGAWDEEWAQHLAERLKHEVEQALGDALRDTKQTTMSWMKG